MSKTPVLTERQLTNLTDEIRDKMVETLCSKVMDETAEDAQLISGILKRNLGDKINDVLGAPANEAKISDTIFQAINSALRNTVKGPLLLYSLLDNRKSFDAVKILVTKIFTNVYNNSTNKTLSVFIKNLLTKLNDPPYEIWFKQQVQQQGGKKRKTMRKHKSKRKIRTYKNRMIGGDIREKVMRNIVGKEKAAEAANWRQKQRDHKAEIKKAEKAEKAAKVLEQKEKGRELMKEGLKNMFGRKSTDVDKAPESKAPESKTSDEGDSFKGVTDSVSGLLGQQPESKTEEKSEGQNETTEDNESKPENVEGAAGAGEEGAAGAGEEDESRGAGAGDNDEDTTSSVAANVAEQLFKEYNEELINRLMKRIDETEDDLIERVLNAAYKYTTDSGVDILESVNKGIYDSIRITNVLPETTNIIITQALYASSMDVQKSIEQTFMELRKEEVDRGIPADQVKFIPTRDTFINTFLQNFTRRIKEIIIR
tara:strand:+ start:11434 stop:12882 length:1449 start_codon:yes stop_codon:yes gene_type:complete